MEVSARNRPQSTTKLRPSLEISKVAGISVMLADRALLWGACRHAMQGIVPLALMPKPLWHRLCRHWQEVRRFRLTPCRRASRPASRRLAVKFSLSIRGACSRLVRHLRQKFSAECGKYLPKDHLDTAPRKLDMLDSVNVRESFDPVLTYCDSTRKTKFSLKESYFVDRIWSSTKVVVTDFAIASENEYCECTP